MIGTALHSAVLEPNEFAAMYALSGARRLPGVLGYMR